MKGLCQFLGLLLLIAALSIFVKSDDTNTYGGDNQRCPDGGGWQLYNGNCYKAFYGNLSVEDARTACKALNSKADLVSIDHEGEDCLVRGLGIGILSQLVASPNFYRIHNGINLVRDASGAITGASWSDGTSFAYGSPTAANFVAGRPPWADGSAWGSTAEPKSNPNANCGAMLWNSKCAGDWAAQPCTGVYGGYVCKIPGGAPPPTNINCPSGYIQWSGSCYKVYNQSSSSLATATSTCQADGAHLVAINSEAENSFVIGLISRAIPAPPTSPAYMRIFNGMQATRNANADLTSVSWVDGSNADYGNPLAAGFVAGTYPWSNGSAYGGVAEPKHNSTAVNGFLVKNNLIAGGWCLGPVDGQIDFNGAFVCERTPNY